MNVNAMIEKLRKYAEQARNNHDNYIAEDLDDAATMLSQYDKEMSMLAYLDDLEAKNEKLRAELKQEHADRIRAMTDDELAKFLCDFRSCDSDGHPCNGCQAEPYCMVGHIGTIDWLQQPAEEDT